MAGEKKYRVVVVGLGKRGVHHADAFAQNPRFEVVGLCDVNPTSLSTASQKFPNAETGSDAAALAAKLKPDVFCFCTLPTLRLPMIRAGVEGGARLIAFEKPIAMSSAEAMDIKKLLDSSGVKAVVSHQHRYGEHYQKVKEIIAAGSLGRVHTVYGHATGWMMHMLSHLIEYVRWYNEGAEAEWVIAQAAGRGKFADIHASPDYIGGFIQFSNGVRGIVECGAGAPDVPEVDYWWRKGRVGAQGTNGFAEVLIGGGWRAVTSGFSCSGPGSMDYAHDTPPYIQDIADWLDDSSKVHPCAFDSAYQGQEIMMALCRSAAGRGQVALPLDRPENELELLKASVPDREVLLSMAENAKEYRK